MKRHSIDCDRCKNTDIKDSVHLEIPVWDHVRTCAADTDCYDMAPVDLCTRCTQHIFIDMVASMMYRTPNLKLNREYLDKWKVPIPKDPRKSTLC